VTLGNLVLTATASVAIFAGASYQTKKPQSLPLQLFGQAKHDDFLGDTKCAECHTDTVANFTKSAHSTYMHVAGQPLDKQGCEACHGPGALHVREDDSKVIAYPKLSPKEVADACLRCHGDLMKKSHWQTEAHSRANVSCVDCHQIHPKEDQPNVVQGNRGIVKTSVFAAVKNPGPLLKSDEPTLCNKCHKSEVSQFRQNSHHPIPEGRMTCSDCHSIHPTNADRMKAATSTKGKCVTCHGEIAGPFAFEHDPVAGWTGSGCVECHKPHGSNNPTLLKSFSRGLCSQCHTDKAVTHHPGQSCWNAGCHVAIHGSNTSRVFLSR
jgi:predicted CXXCH cytochrome family protein